MPREAQYRQKPVSVYSKSSTDETVSRCSLFDEDIVDWASRTKRVSLTNIAVPLARTSRTRFGAPLRASGSRTTKHSFRPWWPFYEHFALLREYSRTRICKTWRELSNLNNGDRSFTCKKRSNEECTKCNCVQGVLKIWFARDLRKGINLVVIL